MTQERESERANVWRRRDFFDFARAQPIILDDRLKREWLRLLSDCLPSANDMLGSGREGIDCREIAVDSEESLNMCYLWVF